MRLAFDVFRDLWDDRIAANRDESKLVQRDIASLERKIALLLVCIVESNTASVIATYEHKLQHLEEEKAVFSEKQKIRANCYRVSKRVFEPLLNFSQTLGIFGLPSDLRISVRSSN